MADEKPPAETPKTAKSQQKGAVSPVRPKKAARLSPVEWRDRIRSDRSAHAAADVIHGWTMHQRQEAQHLKISEEDYRDALKSAQRFRPHAPALSPHVAERRLKGDDLKAYLDARSN